jgi:hypothetical protein
MSTERLIGAGSAERERIQKLDRLITRVPMPTIGSHAAAIAKTSRASLWFGSNPRSGYPARMQIA